MNGIIAGSISPHLVPIIKPSSGVRPIEVSTTFPPSTAAIEAPFPKWQVIIFKSAMSFPNISAALWDTYLWEVPWNPYLLTPYSVYSLWGRPYKYEDAGIVWWNAVSNTPTFGTPGSTAFIASIPIKLAGLWRGANSLHFLIASSTSSVIITEDANFSPPWTTLCPTASISFMSLTPP